jgi:hypothetical protein
MLVFLKKYLPILTASYRPAHYKKNRSGQTPLRFKLA